MKALSVRQPWAWAILHAGKDVENRTWGTRFRGQLAIHAGKSIDKEAVARLRMSGYDVPMNLPTGCLVGEIEVTDCVNNRFRDKVSSEWAEDNFCFMLANPQPYKTPIPYKGQLGLFDVEV